MPVAGTPIAAVRQRARNHIETKNCMSDEIAGNLSDEEQLQLFRKMLLIRKVEEALGAASHAGELPGPVHLYVGQEAVAVGVCAHLTDHDWIASTHRGHGHFLAKGGDPKR